MTCTNLSRLDHTFYSELAVSHIALCLLYNFHLIISAISNRNHGTNRESVTCLYFAAGGRIYLYSILCRAHRHFLLPLSNLIQPLIQWYNPFGDKLISTSNKICPSRDSWFQTFPWYQCLLCTSLNWGRQKDRWQHWCFR